MLGIPTIVSDALERSNRADFKMSSELEVGKLLAVLASSVQMGGRILEIGTGIGLGTAWLVAGLGSRTDVELVTVEVDVSISNIARGYNWPDWVSFRVGDVLDMYDDLGKFNLIFSDAQGGKWVGLDLTIKALKAGGLLAVDDMTPKKWNSENHKKQTEQVRKTLMSHPELQSCELATSSGIILSSKVVV